MESFEIILRTPDNRTQAVHCKRVLRTVPGRRTVFEGEWQERPVIVKRFEDMFSGYRCSRERRGTERLLERGLPTPKILFTGKDAQGHHLLVVEKIEDARDILAAITLDRPDEAKAVLLDVFGCLARLHQAGILQHDLHPGNFLLSAAGLYAIDPACMRFRRHPVPADLSCRQLAMLLASLPRDVLVWQAELIGEYCRIRRMECTDERVDTVRRLTQRRRQQYLPHALKKTMRNSRNFLVHKTPSVWAIFNKAYFDAAKGDQLVEILQGRSGDSSQSFNLDFLGSQFYVTEDRAVNGIVAFGYGLTGSSARRAWKNAWAAVYTGQSTREPAALIEQRSGLLVRRAWLVTKADPIKNVPHCE